MINWKRKLTSRKFWAAIAGFISMLLIALGKDAGLVQQVTGLIMAGASLIAYIIGEGLADSAGNVIEGEEFGVAETSSKSATEFIGFNDSAEGKNE